MCSTPESPSEAAALHTEHGLGTILDGIGEGFYAVDRQWRILLFNGEAERHFHVSAPDVLGKVLWDAFPRARETGLGQLFMTTMASRATIRSETESVVFPGRWMAYRLFPLADGMGIVFRDTTDRRRAESERDLLTRELEHRIKNTLSIVQAIALQTFGSDGQNAEAQQKFGNRLVALGRAHSILTEQSWESADMQEVMLTALRPHHAPDLTQIAVAGPMLRVGPRCAVALSMAVHELCTNATKYGALSSPQGRIKVDWSVAGSRFHWRWRERDGPPVAPPRRTGFGSRLIERMLAAQLAGTTSIAYDPRGVVCEIDAPLSSVRDEGPAA